MPRHARERSPDYSRKYPALARRRAPNGPARHAYHRVVAGRDDCGQSVHLTDAARLTHALTVGTTGSGKTTFMKNLVIQDARRGLGGMLLDPHGGHPGSLYAETLSELHTQGFFATGRVHVIDLGVREFVTPLNPLARLHGTDISVIADAMLTAFERAWDDENTHEKPTIRTVLKATFAALAEMNLPLADARLFFDPHDQAGLRARTITQIENEYARNELERLHQVALDDRSKREFNAQVIGPINRLAEFTSSDVLSAMFGVVDAPGAPRRTLDLLDIMERGHWLLVNLQHGASVSEADANLVGTILLRYLLLLAPRRSNREPFFVTIDETHCFLSGDDLPSALAECRKFGMGLHMGLQYLAQAGPRDGLMYQALMNCTEIKTVLRIKSPEEAQTLAEFVMPLSLERPVAASVRPTAVGQRRVRLAASSRSKHESDSVGEAITDAEMRALTIGNATATTTSSASAVGSSELASQLMTPPLQLFGPNAPDAALIPTTLSQTAGSGASELTTSGTATSEISSESVTEARSRATTSSVSRSRGTSETDGWHEGHETIYRDLPSAFHGKEAELYFLGEELRALPTGHAVLSTRGATHRIRIPAPKRQS